MPQGNEFPTRNSFQIVKNLPQVFKFLEENLLFLKAVGSQLAAHNP